MLNAVGYAFYDSETTLEYKGYLNTGDFNLTLNFSENGDANYQGWNLIGNPYASHIDWDIAVPDGAVPAGAENAIYFYDDSPKDHEYNNYRYYVPSTGGTYGVGTENATKYIPAGQGFL